MRIDSVTIHNFRSISEITFEMEPYSLLIGANNAGKSNVIDALRVFYEKDIKYDYTRDWPKFSTEDGESWIDIEYVLTDDEYGTLKQEYRRPNNGLKVRKYLKIDPDGLSNVKPGIYGYEGDTIASTPFYGAKNIQQAKLGDVVYIPALSKLDEHTKLSGPSVIRDLLQDIIRELVSSSAAYAGLREEFGRFAEGFKLERTEDRRSLSGLEQEINQGLGDWDARFSIQINPVGDSDIVKNLISFGVRDGALDQDVDAFRFGHGFQRYLIYTLLRVAPQYQGSAIPSARKDLEPQFTLLLFEEPEAFLHPAQQDDLCRSLRTLGSQAGKQVLVSSHSPRFVSHNSQDIPGIIRLCRRKAQTTAGQVSPRDQNRIFADNQEINTLLQGTKYAPTTDDLKEDMEAVKYGNWLDPFRCGAFFAGHVLLVEGPTEVVLINELVDQGRIKPPRDGIFVLDCIGKFNIHRFMNLFGALGISHSVLHDGDAGSDDLHKAINALIAESENVHTHEIASFPKDIETFLGVTSPGRGHRKPQHMMLKLKEKAIPSDRLDALAHMVQDLVPAADAKA